MADRNKAAAIDALLADLSRATIGTTFNQFREAGPDDVPGAPAIRLANLRQYLEERGRATVVAVGEAGPLGPAGGLAAALLLLCVVGAAMELRSRRLTPPPAPRA